MSGLMFPKSAIIKALRNTGGIVKNAAESLDCDRGTIYKAIKLSGSPVLVAYTVGP